MLQNSTLGDPTRVYKTKLCSRHQAVEHIIGEESDHTGLLICVLETTPSTVWIGSRPFHYEEAWTCHEKYDEMVSGAWATMSIGDQGITTTCEKLRRVWGHMQAWSHEVFSSIQEQIANLKQQVGDSKKRSIGLGHTPEINDIEQH